MNPLPEDLPCEACGADPHEPCRPYCIGEAAWVELVDAAMTAPATRTSTSTTPTGVTGSGTARLAADVGSPWDDAEVVSVYTRSQAIADGVLITVPAQTASEAGSRVPVALTAGAWADCVAWPDTAEAAKPHGTGQDETGRLWDVLTMARHAAARAQATSRTSFDVLRVPATGRGVQPRRARLVLHIGPGDDGEPVITISLPGED